MKSIFRIIMASFAATVVWQTQSAPSDLNERIRSAKVFTEPVVWIGDAEPSDQESYALWVALQNMRRDGFHHGCRYLEDFIAANPSSPWVPSLRARLANAYRDTGRYTRALEHWEAVWNNTGQFTNGTGKAVADVALANWTRLLSSLGRLDSLSAIFEEIGERRTLDLGSQEILNRSRRNMELMKTDPGISYKCGTLGLWHAYSALRKVRTMHGAILDIPSPPTGFSMSALSALCKDFKIPFVAVKRPTAGTNLVVPSVVHWRQNHYAAIIAKNGAYLQVMDPTFGRSAWLHEDVINEEASGYFFVPAEQKPADWLLVTGDEADLIFGKGLGGPHVNPQPPCPEEGSDTCCVTDSGGGPGGTGPPGMNGGNNGCKGCPPGVVKGGMPTWEVGEPSVDLWIRDIPMSYQPSVGPPFELRMFYHEDDDHFANTTFGFGPKWNANILTYFQAIDQAYDDMRQFSGTLFGSGGGRRNYSFDDIWPDSHAFTTMERVLDGSSNLVGFLERFPNGSENYYGFLFDLGGPYAYVRAFLSERRNPQGVVTAEFRYATNSGLLTSIIDADGLTNIIRYHPFLPGYISEIENPYGHVVQFHYHELDPFAEYGVLTNIVDVMNLSTVFQYALPGNVPTMTNMITPYGNTLFEYLVNTGLEGLSGTPSGTDNINRAIKVTEPTGGSHLYMYRNSSENLVRFGTNVTFLPWTYPTNHVPDGVPVNGQDGLGNCNMYYRNTFYWGPRQYAGVGNTWTNLSVEDYRRARLRNWLHSSWEGAPYVSRTLNMERNFGVHDDDVLIEGEKLWYGYHGRNPAPSSCFGYYSQFEGTNSKPSWVAIRLPNGETRYTYKEYNYLGMPTLEASSYTVGSGYAGRTNTLHYAANDVDLIAITNQLGEREWTASYNSDHQILFETNAAGEVTSRTYDSSGRLTSRTTAAGLTTTNLYTNGRLTQTIDIEINRTNSFTWSSGQVRSHTDERGLTITNSWDALRRLTNVAYPDGTFIAYTYTNLDLVKIVDRMGFVTEFGYDAGRRKVWQLDARTNMTLFQYCSCGSLEAITNAVGEVTNFSYDNQGKLTMISYWDGYQEIQLYDSVGQLRSRMDSTFNETRYNYNNQGLLAGVSNAFGRVSSTLYDFKDHPTNIVDSTGVSVASAYDDLGRIVWRKIGTLAAETFLHTNTGLIAHTNQLGKVARYFCDQRGRTIIETNALGDDIQYSYDPSGSLLTLTDAKDQVTRWKYDEYGRVTNKLEHLTNTTFNYKYDANGRLTNRWTPAKGHAFYTYDGAGNLTFLNYSNSADLTFSYDPLNRVTNMLDAVGTTKYTYDTAGQLASEDGPWDSDIMTFGYNNRLRTGLTLEQMNGSPWEQTYGYDAARRLSTLTSPAGTFSYGYPASGATIAPASPLHLRLGLPNGAYITNAYDSLARLTNTSLMNSSHAVLNAHAYTYNDGYQRTRQTRTGGDFIDYGYDDIGQLKVAIGMEPGGTTNRVHERLGYKYDAAGNLLDRTNNVFVQSFTVNGLNQLSGSSRSGTFTVAGTTTSPATNVTVNSSTALRYADYTFASTNHTLANGNNTFTAKAWDTNARIDTNVVVAYLPSSATFVYDANGNMVYDGQKAFAYDDENQLSRITATNLWKSEFTYDGKMRRRIRKEYTWRSSAWVLTNEFRYIYDDNLVIQERDANNIPEVTYTRGVEMAAFFDADGAGGMLARTTRYHTTAKHGYFHSDANGNTSLVINTQGVVIAQYTYEPSGRLLKEFEMADFSNLYRFSSKEYHVQSGLILYLYRLYSPSLQRWLTQDPLQEYASLNLYGFVKNSPVNYVDLYGLDGQPVADPPTIQQPQAEPKLTGPGNWPVAFPQPPPGPSGCNKKSDLGTIRNVGEPYIVPCTDGTGCTGETFKKCQNREKCKELSFSFGKSENQHKGYTWAPISPACGKCGKP